jgi:uncharacterized membrane protein YoaK (UPF0700 family)
MAWRAPSTRASNAATRRASPAAGRRRRPDGKPEAARPQQHGDAKTEAAAPDHFDLLDLGLALLGFASGAMDALAFFSLGEAFPSAMTGNTALLGLALGQGRAMAALSPVVAFAGFLLGAAIASANAGLRLARLSAPRAASWLLGFESCLLAAFALAYPLALRPIPGAWIYGLVFIAAAAMGFQSVAARLMNRPGVTTVVFTSTLTAIVSATTQAVVAPPHRLPFATKRQIGMFLIYGCGAAGVGLFAPRGPAIAFIPLAAVLAALGFHLRAGRSKS